jgi:membrane protease subunit HflC
MGNVTRNVLGQTTLREILSEKRSEIMLTIRDEVNRAMKDGGFGVEIVDIRIVRADLTQKLRASTVNRMITERRQAATETRARGREKALEIRSTAEKEKTVLLANAQRDSQIIRAEGDKEAIRIYAKAFNRDPSFYAFLRSMEAYGNVLDSEETQMILSPDSEFLRYFKNK